MVAEMPVSMGIAKVSTTAEMSNRYRRSLPCHAIDLTLSENMGSSDTRSNDPAKASTDRPITHSVRSAATAAGCCSAIRASEASNDDQKMACAGTGKPMKEVVWRASLLNLASRRADPTGMVRTATVARIDNGRGSVASGPKRLRSTNRR